MPSVTPSRRSSCSHDGPTSLKADDRFEVIDEPQLSVVAFRIRGKGSVADRINEDLMRRVNARGRVFLSSTRLDGRYVIRLCVLSFRTHLDRVRDAVEAIIQEAGAALDTRGRATESVRSA